MKLFDDEQTLCRLDKVDVVLTTHRVRRGDDANFTSILLEQVCSVRVERKAYGWALFLAIGCGLAALALGIAAANTLTDSEKYRAGMIITGILGATFLLIYYLTRYSIVQIASSGAAIEFRFSRVGRAKVLEFVTALELAKSERHALRRTKIVVG